MLCLFRSSLLLMLTFVVCIVDSSISFAQPGEGEILQAMKKSTDFMMNTVSNRGGSVWNYTADLSEQWGEVPARKSMIWVQGPGTVGVGMMLLDAYKATDDLLYLRYAKQVAGALIWGQHPSGGWHYFIDFDMTGIQQWYDEVGSKCWGWEEFYHYYDNCTYDDDVTTGATRFLLELYMTTLDPKYRVPLLKALDFILESQYPNGGWPQRYPLRYEFSHHGLPDYTHYYTFNDNVIQGNIYLLIEAWEKLGNEKYKKAALSGMDFCILAQLPPPQTGWGQQYNMSMESVQARSYEPASVMPAYTVQISRDLMTFYKITGDRRYIKGIPDAIEWLEKSYLPEDHKMNERVTHPSFIELGTNKPLYNHRKWESDGARYFYIDYIPKNFMGGYGNQTRLDNESLKKEYERVSSLSPKKAIAEYQSKRDRPHSIPVVDPNKVKNIITTMDERGTWIEKISFTDFDDEIKNPRIEFMGISTRTYINNMKTLLHYVQSLKDNK